MRALCGCCGETCPHDGCLCLYLPSAHIVAQASNEIEIARLRPLVADGGRHGTLGKPQGQPDFRTLLTAPPTIDSVEAVWCDANDLDECVPQSNRTT